MNTNILVLPSGDLASRSSAIHYRLQLEELLSSESQHVIKVDLCKVDSISESYADELFGMLVKEYGLETILNRMKIINGDDYLLGSIASVIQRRALQ